MGAGNCERRKGISYEHGNLTDRIKKKVNDVLIDTNWLNTLVNKGDSKVAPFKLIKYNFTAARLDTRYCCFTDGDINISNSRGRKRIYTSSGLTAMCFHLVDEKGYSFGTYDWP